MVIRKGWPIAMTAWPAKVNQNLKENVKMSNCHPLNFIDNENLVTGETSSVRPGRVDRKRVREPINIQDEPHRTPAYNKHGPQCPASLEMRDSESEVTQPTYIVAC